MRRPVLALLVVLLCSAFQARGFAGCGGAPPSGGAVPMGGEAGCFVDADCAGDMCRTQACLAGRCVDVGILDGDGDGVSPPPCGLDCDDTSPDRSPDTFERCDGVDQDCDETVDEEAVPEPVRWFVPAGGTELPNAVAVALRTTAGGRELILSDVDEAAVRLQRLDVFGGLLELVEVPRSGVRAHDLVRRDDGALVLVALVPAEARLLVVELDDGLTPTPLEVPIGPAASGLVATAYPGGVAAVWVEGGSEIHGWTSESAAPFPIAPLTESGPLGLTALGTSLVLAAPTNLALFLDPATGAVVAMRNLDAPRTWAEGALASGGGLAFALTRDAFDLSLARLDPAAPLRFTPAPSVPNLGIPGRIDAFGDRIVVTRLPDPTSAGTLIGVLDPSLVVRASYDTSAFGPGTSTGWDVAMDADAIAIINAFAGEVHGVTLYCGSR